MRNIPSFYSIKSKALNRFLCCDRGSKFIANRTAKGQWETFFVKDIKDGSNGPKMVCFMTHHKEYLCVLPAGSLVENRYGPQTWESFEIVYEPFPPTPFGSTLTEIMAQQQNSGTAAASMKIPEALYILAKAINDHGGHKIEGIFRIPGDMQNVNRIKKKFNHGFYDEDLSCCHDAATLFKLFFRELKTPLIPDEYYSAMLRCGQEKNVAGMKALIRLFPVSHQDVLWWVVSYLQTFLVPETIELTKMDMKNVALVFSASLFRCPNSDPLVQINASGIHADATLFLLGFDM